MTVPAKQVLYVTKTSLYGGTGGEKRAREVTRRLADRDHEITIVCGKTDSGLQKWQQHRGCRVRHVYCVPDWLLSDTHIGFYLPRYLFPFVSVSVLVWQLMFEEYDVLIENMTPYPTLAILIASMFEVPIIAVKHEFHGSNCTERYGTVTGRILRVVQNMLLVADYDLIIVPTEHIKRKFVDYGVPERRLVVIPNGIAYERYRRPDIEREPDKLVTIGRLERRKGHDDLIRVLARLQPEQPGIHLDIVGTGSQRAHLEALANRLKVDDAVTFHGFVNNEEKIRLLNRSEVFIFASHQEGFGLVLLEAMAAGLPVVARELPVYRAFFEDGINGYLVSGDVVADIADQTSELLADADRRGAITRRNVATASKFGWDRTVDETEAVIERICNRPSETVTSQEHLADR